MHNDSIHWLILTGVPFENSGGAQRAAQISKALVNRGDKVTYLYAIQYREKDSSQINTPSNNFKEYHVRKFDFIRFVNFINKKQKLIVLVEVPHPSFVPIVGFLKKYSYKIIYELIDPWNTELGQSWYKGYIENRIIKLADILTATAKSLQRNLINKSNRQVHLIPNAYNSDLFVKSNYIRPEDLPKGPIIGYIGALWGSWFDIDLIIKVAQNFPDYNIVLIGEYLNQFEAIKLSNIYFLNLKPQVELPSYLNYFDLGIIPFKVNKLTEGVNPLKVYEYLAMEVPVVSTYMPELLDIPNVYMGKDHEEFIQIIKEVGGEEFQAKEVDSWLKENDWNARIQSLINLI